MGKGGYQILDCKGSKIILNVSDGGEPTVITNITNNDVVNAVASNKPIMITNFALISNTAYETGVIAPSQNFWAMAMRPYKASQFDVVVDYYVTFYVLLYATMYVVEIRANINAPAHKPNVAVYTLSAQ